MTEFFNQNPDGSGITGLKYGDRPSSATLPISAVSIAILSPVDPVYFMSAAEVAFLKAEAYARLGNVAKAKEAYNDAVTKAFERWNKDASTFIADGGAYAFDSKDLNSMLTCILTQNGSLPLVAKLGTHGLILTVREYLRWAQNMWMKMVMFLDS